MQYLNRIVGQDMAHQDCKLCNVVAHQTTNIDRVQCVIEWPPIIMGYCMWVTVTYDEYLTDRIFASATSFSLCLRRMQRS
jgi:hypothetical protein